MMSDDGVVKVGQTGQGDDGNDGGGGGGPSAGIIVAYVLFAVGAVLIVIICIWLCIYLSNRRRKKRAAGDASSPTVLYADRESAKVLELPTVTSQKKQVESNNNSSMLVPVTVERNSVMNGGFSTTTRPVMTSTLPKTTYLLEEAVDSPRSAPPKMIYAVDDGTLERAHVKKAYILSSDRPTTSYSLDRGPRSALSLDRGYTTSKSAAAQQSRSRTKSRSSDTRVVLAPVSRAPRQHVTIAQRSDPVQPVKVVYQQQSVTQSMPTLLRIQPSNIGKSRTTHHYQQQQQQQQQHHQEQHQNQMYYVLSDNEGNVTGNGSHVDDWVERHHAAAASSREKISYEDVVDSGREKTQRTPDEGDSLYLRWSPTMRRKLELQREDARNAKSLPVITTTEPDGKTIQLHGSVDDGLY